MITKHSIVKGLLKSAALLLVASLLVACNQHAPAKSEQKAAVANVTSEAAKAVEEKAAVVIAPPSAVSGKFSGEASRSYESICGVCHMNEGFGVWSLRRRLGPEMSQLHERDNLTPKFIKHAVRKGFLAMPALSKSEVSDAELEMVVEYLTKNNKALEIGNE